MMVVVLAPRRGAAAQVMPYFAVRFGAYDIMQRCYAGLPPDDERRRLLGTLSPAATFGMLAGMAAWAVILGRGAPDYGRRYLGRISCARRRA